MPPAPHSASPPSPVRQSCSSVAPSPARQSCSSVDSFAAVLRAGLENQHGGAARGRERWREHLRRIADEAEDLCDVPREVSRLLRQELGAEGAPEEARAECQMRMAQLTEEYEASLRSVRAEFARARWLQEMRGASSTNAPSGSDAPVEATDARPDSKRARAPPSLLGQFVEDCEPPEVPKPSQNGDRCHSRPGSAGKLTAGGFPLGASCAAPQSPQQAELLEGAGAGGATLPATAKKSSIQQSSPARSRRGTVGELAQATCPSTPQARCQSSEKRASMRWVVDSLPRRSNTALCLRRCGNVASPPALPGVSGDYISLRMTLAVKTRSSQKPARGGRPFSAPAAARRASARPHAAPPPVSDGGPGTSGGSPAGCAASLRDPRVARPASTSAPGGHRAARSISAPSGSASGREAPQRSAGPGALVGHTMLTSAIMHAAVRLGVPDAQCTW